MYPELVRFGNFAVTSFGVMVALGALVGLWILSRELRRSKLPPGALDAAIYGVIGGLAGAKLLWFVEHLGEGPSTDLLFSRGGLSWYGGLAGGVGAGVITIFAKRLRVVPILAAATPALAIGHAIGRVGCFLVGDDYGRPSDLPWAVAFPEGLPPTDIPAHPTQLYELAALLPLAWMLTRMRRGGVSDRVVLGTYLIGAGAIRFAIEWFRVNPPVAVGMSVAHWASLAAVGAGLALTVRGRRTPQ